MGCSRADDLLILGIAGQDVRSLLLQSIVLVNQFVVESVLANLVHVVGSRGARSAGGAGSRVLVSHVTCQGSGGGFLCVYVSWVWSWVWSWRRVLYLP
jgi:hypothetical protein